MYPVVGKIEGVSLVRREVQEVLDLPEPREGVYYVVSVQVWEALKDRRDILLPEYPVRNEWSRVTGCLAFRVRGGKHAGT